MQIAIKFFILPIQMAQISIITRIVYVKREEIGKKCNETFPKEFHVLRNS